MDVVEAITESSSTAEASGGRCQTRRLVAKGPGSMPGPVQPTSVG